MLPLLLSVSLMGSAAASASAQRPRSVITRGDGYLHATVNAILGVPALNKRAAAVEAEVVGQKGGTRYGIDIGVGTPAQPLTLIIDTGSPDMWVNPRCDTTYQPSECLSYPMFDYTRSSTLQVSGFADVLRYGSGNVTIDYVTDTVTIGSAKITNQIFGIGFDSFNIPLGILGLSPALASATTSPYPFVLDTLVDQGIIKSRAFSLDLRSITEPAGAVVFGGIDKSKFSGSLTRVPMLDPSVTPGGTNRYWITLTGIGLTFPDGTADRSGAIEVPVFPDSGGTLSQLPTPIFQAFEVFPTAQFDPKSGFWIIDCRVLDQPGTVDFYFGSKRIAVPYRDFAWHLDDGSCVLGVQPTDDEPVLGDSFLRAAYVVHDQDNRALHLAQAASCRASQNIITIGSGANAVPSGIVGDCPEVEAPTATAGGIDATATRKPTNIFSGNSPDVTGIGAGPGPAGGRASTT
ncbi:aspartic peptidase domain-containing protein, partial [Echria macrotheca]